MDRTEVLLTELVSEITDSDIDAAAESNRRVSEAYDATGSAGRAAVKVSLVMVAHDLEGELY